MLKYAKVQRRIYRVVIVIAASFLCTSFVTLILTQTVVQKMAIMTRDYSTPYIFVFVLFNCADTSDYCMDITDRSDCCADTSDYCMADYCIER